MIPLFLVWASGGAILPAKESQGATELRQSAEQEVFQARSSTRWHRQRATGECARGGRRRWSAGAERARVRGVLYCIVWHIQQRPPDRAQRFFSDVDAYFSPGHCVFDGPMDLQPFRSARLLSSIDSFSTVSGHAGVSTRCPLGKVGLGISNTRIYVPASSSSARCKQVIEPFLFHTRTLYSFTWHPQGDALLY